MTNPNPVHEMKVILIYFFLNELGQIFFIYHFGQFAISHVRLVWFLFQNRTQPLFWSSPQQDTRLAKRSLQDRKGDIFTSRLAISLVEENFQKNKKHFTQVISFICKYGSSKITRANFETSKIFFAILPKFNELRVTF